MIEIINRLTVVNSARLVAVSGYIAYLIVSMYLCVTGGSFQYYSEFAALTTGSGTLAALGGKYIDAALNSPRGEMPKQ